MPDIAKQSDFRFLAPTSRDLRLSATDDSDRRQRATISSIIYEKADSAFLRGIYNSTTVEVAKGGVYAKGGIYLATTIF